MLRIKHIKDIIINRLTSYKRDFNRFTTHAAPTERRVALMLELAATTMSIATAVSLIMLIGFDHSQASTQLIYRCLKWAQIIFLVNIIFNLIFRFRNWVKKTRTFGKIVQILTLSTIIPLIYPQPDSPWIQWLNDMLYSRIFTYSILVLYSVVCISYGITNIMGKRTNPALILGFSFIFFIIIGSFLLMMPKCTQHPLGYVDSLFVSTSAVCITGLTPVDISTTFTPLGLLILALLIQIGGLGVLTFTSFFAMFFSGNTSVYSQLMVKDMVYTKTMNNLLPTLLYILGFTLVLELVGAAVIFLSIHNTLGLPLRDELIFSGFHSLTAFCNAGFSNIEGGLSNPLLLHSNQSIYIIVTVLVLAGGIGFPILVNIKQAAGRTLRRVWCTIRKLPQRHEAANIYDLNTKIVLWTTLVLFAVSSVLFYIFESNNSMSGMSTYDKVIQSVFNSFVPRSSGFSSVSPITFANVTIIMMMILMWIGGASQSTAGGIKVNTLTTSLLNLRASIYGRKEVNAFHRQLSAGSLQRANAVIILSFIAISLYSMIMIALEPELPLKSVLFETVSALFTVGSSLGITAELSDMGKIVLCTAMFLGRVGILSLLIGLASRVKSTYAHYPTGDVIIN